MKTYLYELVTGRKRGLGPALLRALLRLLSPGYGLAVATWSRLVRLRPFRAPCCVVSVGNISVGGTGKTPLTEYIARFLAGQGRSVCVISRGYARSRLLRQGDEPAMLAGKLAGIPVIVDAKRSRAIARAVTAHHADTVVLDDGFQQWRLVKDLEIVTLDAIAGLDGQRLLPCGLLREPLTGLRRAHIIVLHNAAHAPALAGLVARVGRLAPQALIVTSGSEPYGLYRLGGGAGQLDPGFLRGRTVGLFCGIGNPASFERTVNDLGAGVAACVRFSDHHQYGEKDAAAVAAEAGRRRIRDWVTTEKDAQRIDPRGWAGRDIDLYVLQVRLRIFTHEDELHRRLRALCAV